MPRLLSVIVGITLISGIFARAEDAEPGDGVVAALKKIGAQLKESDGKVVGVDFVASKTATLDQLRRLRAFTEIELIGTGPIALTATR